VEGCRRLPWLAFGRAGLNDVAPIPARESVRSAGQVAHGGRIHHSALGERGRIGPVPWGPVTWAGGFVVGSAPGWSFETLVNADIDRAVACIGNVAGGLRALLTLAGPACFDLLG